MRFAALFLLIMVCISCNKKTEIYPIDIIIDLNDDVSPVLGKFSLPGEYDYFEWTFEGLDSPMEYSANPASHVFETKGPTSVKVVAYKNSTNEKFIGSSEFTIPDIAKKLKITGFFFKDSEASDRYNQKQINVYLHYLKYGVSTVNSFSVPAKGITPNDTIFFPEPVIYDIDGFITGTFSENDIFVTINAAPDNSLLFKSSFNLTGRYLHDHPLMPDFIYLDNMTPGKYYYIYLLCDWMPE